MTYIIKTKGVGHTGEKRSWYKMALKRKASFAELVEENREQILQDREQMDEIEAKLEKEKRVSLRKLD